MDFYTELYQILDSNSISYKLDSMSTNRDKAIRIILELKKRKAKKSKTLTVDDEDIINEYLQYGINGIKKMFNKSDCYLYSTPFVFDILFTINNPIIFIEGYSFGSKGQGLFQIAENCGILKYRLLEKGYSYNTVVPSVVKKGATGKGNADKDKMYEAFVKETKIDLKKLFDTDKVGNPISDIVDSYFIQKVGYDNLLCS